MELVQYLICNMVRDLRSKGAIEQDASECVNELSDEVKRYLEALIESQTEKLLGRITALEDKLLEKGFCHRRVERGISE